ncbi:hypothetical protein [Aphanothece sacrum]|uniref:Gll0169 protein n=1 Tax=Aphanothece sacrum FPU1 TaxID=1920663 RepID=A0A401IJU7_APHSA|nr:hypothetical protein [Aphanothece sacrum]GBF81585.1 Gll0169 protein [Aphanothece sacrum FPU1]GBF84157.1 Gll0169 protein [Aphanothece sacrum FPU3]
MYMYLICPGIHEQKLTDKFIENALNNLDFILVFPTDKYPAYSGFHILKFLQEKSVDKSQQLVIISFSAGVVGAINAAWTWQLQGGIIKGFIAFDGWGVPLMGNFPIYRVSHDEFTYWTSAILGTGTLSFYADPPVEHLDLWRSPQLVKGWMVEINNYGKKSFSPISLSDFLALIKIINT